MMRTLGAVSSKAEAGRRCVILSNYIDNSESGKQTDKQICEWVDVTLHGDARRQ